MKHSEADGQANEPVRHDKVVATDLPHERPSVAVSMPAHNAARWIETAIDSVLAQKAVEVHLVVVDDASTDRTAALALARARAGPQVTVLRNEHRRGIAACHNRAVAVTDAPFIAHVDADDIIEPGALEKLTAALLSRPDGGQAYCDFYPIDADGLVDPELQARWADLFHRARRPPIDYARELVVHGMVVSALRTYRRAALDEIGAFDESLEWAVDYEMALRMAERFTFVHVPEPLYGRRLHPGGASQGHRSGPLRQWLMRWKLVRRRLRAQRGHVLGHGTVVTHARLLGGLTGAVRGAVSRGRGP